MGFKNYFEIPNNVTYLNTAGNGVLPTTHFQWRREREQEFFDLGSDLRDHQSEFIAAVKVDFSKLFHCAIERLFFVPNFSFGQNTLLDGLDKDLKFLLLSEEYPSLNYPIISRGFQYDILEVSTTLEDDIHQYLSTHSIDVLVLSIVNYIHGFKIDLDFIKKLRVDFPELLIIGDATQYLGTEPFNFEESGFDAVGGSGYKWLLSGFGNGYMMLSDRMTKNLFQEAYDKPRPKESWWLDKSVLNIYFEPGHQDTLAYGSIGQSILFFNEIGLANIKVYLEDLRKYAYSIFQKRQWLLPFIEDRKVQSSLINIQIDQSMYSYLMDKGIKCFPRGSGIRIGLHIYNTKEDIDRLVEVIDSYKNEFKNR